MGAAVRGVAMATARRLRVLCVGVGIVQRQIAVIVKVCRLTLGRVVAARTEFVLERLLLGVGCAELSGRAVRGEIGRLAGAGVLLELAEFVLIVLRLGVGSGRLLEGLLLRDLLWSLILLLGI